MKEYVITITSQSSNSYLISARSKEDAITKALEFFSDDNGNLDESIINISIDVDLNEEYDD